jgi:hypothetical protein
VHQFTERVHTFTVPLHPFTDPLHPKTHIPWAFSKSAFICASLRLYSASEI